MKLTILLLAAVLCCAEARVRFETESLDGNLVGTMFMESDDRSDNNGSSGEGEGIDDGEDSEEDDNDMMMLPPGVGDRDVLMEGTDHLPTEWTHLNDNNVMDTLHLPPEDSGSDRSNAREKFSMKDRIVVGPADRNGNEREDAVHHDVLRLPAHVIQADNENRDMLTADRNLPATSCLKIKIVYGSGFLALFSNDQAQARAAIVQLVRDTNARFKQGNYPGLNADITVDVLDIAYLSNAPNAATGGDIGGSAVRNYINSDPERASVHHYAFLAPGGPLPGVVGIAYLGTACLSGATYAYYKVSINEYYKSNTARGADTLAHEIGHALGMDHDFTYRNGQRVGYVLVYSDGRQEPCMGVGGIMDYYNSKTKWSGCSRYFVNRYMQGRFCMPWPASGQCNSGWETDSSAPVAPTSPSADCDQYGSTDECASKAGQCSDSYVKTYCRKTCSNCNECSDYMSALCPYLPEVYCYDGIYASKYKNFGCIKRCKGCTGDSGIAKPAEKTNCVQYEPANYCASVSSQCQTNPKVMIGCRNTCKTCGVCSDLATNCSSFLSFCNRGYLWMDYYYCIKSCGKCSS